jgi:hypothetical protein
MAKYRLINIADILCSPKNILIQGAQENCHIADERTARINSACRSLLLEHRNLEDFVLTKYWVQISDSATRVFGLRITN